MKSFLRRYWFSILVLTALGGFLGVHAIWYIHPSEIKSVEELQARLDNGQPTVIEFYSNL
jgi:hypothetical protein